MNPYVRQDGMFSRLKPVRKVKKTKKNTECTMKRKTRRNLVSDYSLPET